MHWLGRAIDYTQCCWVQGSLRLRAQRPICAHIGWDGWSYGCAQPHRWNSTREQNNVQRRCGRTFVSHTDTWRSPEGQRMSTLIVTLLKGLSDQIGQLRQSVEVILYIYKFVIYEFNRLLVQQSLTRLNAAVTSVRLIANLTKPETWKFGEETIQRQLIHCTFPDCLCRFTR